MKNYNRKKSSKKLFQGIINFSNKRDPIVECDKINHVIKLSNNIVNFLHGDLVEFEILNRKRKGFYTANIISLVKRNKEEYVGIIQINKNFAFTIIDDRKIHSDIFIRYSLLHIDHNLLADSVNIFIVSSMDCMAFS